VTASINFRIARVGIDPDRNHYFEFKNGAEDRLWVRADEALSTPKVLNWAQRKGLPVLRGQMAWIRDLVATAPSPSITVLSNRGWHQSGSTFHYASEFGVVGPDADKFVMLGGRSSVPPVGSNMGWSESVLGFTRVRAVEHGTYWNQLVIVAFLAAVSAPFLALLNRDAFVLHIVGPTSRGKTILARAIGSLYGGRTGELIRANLTEEKINPLLVERDGAVCVVDDPRQIKASPKKAATIYLNWIFRAASGEPRRTYGTEDVERRFRTLLVTTSNHDLDELLDIAGFASDDRAHHARVIQLYADRAQGVFDRVPAGQAAVSFARDLEKFAQDTRSACMDRIVEEIARVWSDRTERASAEARFYDDERYFNGYYEREALSGLQHRQLSYLSFLYAAGCFFWRRDLLPSSFNPLPLSRALMSAFERNRVSGAPDAELPETVISRYISGHKLLLQEIDINPPNVSEEEFHETPGFIRRRRGGRTEICLTPARVKHLIPSSEARSTMGERLFERGLIEAESSHSGRRYDVKRMVRANKPDGDRMWTFKPGIEAL